jgi:hypothetical protein
VRQAGLAPQELADLYSADIRQTYIEDNGVGLCPASDLYRLPACVRAHDGESRLPQDAFQGARRPFLIVGH